MTTQGNPVIHDIKHTADTLLGKGRWLSLHQVQFQDPSGTERGWEVCRRVKPVSANPASNTNSINNEASVDGVDVITIIKNSANKATHIVLVTQYRPALAAYSIEFPSGLIDAGEALETAALRELEEETGFSTQAGHSLKIVKVGVPVSYEPGLTGSCSRVVVVEVQMEEEQLFGPESTLQKAKPEDDEWSLQVLVLPLPGLLQSLQDLQEKVGGQSKLILDSRLYAWALGRELGY
ncbi:nudix hydrolase-like protein [Linnemannia schmuckeri]|uniref:Nudix hydrolase-like protein n=1 Tax=Linnemannia schmuckeri TaxID=64567 RepID=A0A9P5RTX4_9FUNG|nr:nudix hydrolase-like protein [Linnemannia schmuckeri]